MKKVRITVMKTARYDDLIAQYENPIEHACYTKTFKPETALKG